MKKIYLSILMTLCPYSRAWHNKYRKPDERPLADGSSSLRGANP